jgi:hypothetical protein
MALCEPPGADLLRSIQELIQQTGQATPDDPHQVFVVQLPSDQRVVSFLYGSGMPLPVYLVTGDVADLAGWELLAEHAGTPIVAGDPVVQEAAELVRSCTMGG